VRPQIHFAPLIALSVLAACSISPLQGRIDVGEEPFVVFVAEGFDGKTDLFASLPGGGEVSRLTFTDLAETSPRVTREGGLVVFLRVRSPSEPEARDVVIMNLLSGAERRLELPNTAGTPTAVAWTADETGVYVSTGDTTWLVQAPPAEGHAVMLPADRLPVADSAFAVMLGSPAFAVATPCANGGICVTGPSGEPNRLAERGTAPFRWGTDSLAWFEDGVIQVRPLGPGPARAISWSDDRVSGAREGSYAGTIDDRR
jgi:hypothetical protein